MEQKQRFELNKTTLLASSFNLTENKTELSYIVLYIRNLGLAFLRKFSTVISSCKKIIRYILAD